MTSQLPAEQVPGSNQADTIWGRPEAVVLNLARLAVFCSVVERRNFSQAADELSVTQPTVSQHVRALEQVFGTPLFDRRRRGAQLTEAGQAVYDFAVTMRREVDALWARLSDLAGGSGGEVTLGAGLVPGVHVLPGLLARFYQQHPASHVRLRIIAPRLISEEVVHGRIDLGVIGETGPIPDTLQAEPLWSETTVLVAPPEHRLARQPRVLIDELAGEPFVVGPAVSRGAQALDASLRKAGLPPRRIVLELGTQDGVKQAILQGVGLSVLFRSVVAQELALGKLVALPVDDVAVTEQFFLVYRHTHRFSPLAQNLIEFLRAHSGAITEQLLALPTGRRSIGRRTKRDRPATHRATSRAQAGPLELTDAQWLAIEPILSPRGRRGRRRPDDRRLFTGVLWVVTTGAPWAELPFQFGTPAACRKRLQAWQARGTWKPAWEAWLATLDDRTAFEGLDGHLEAG